MKPNFKKLALLGITSGLLVSQQVHAESEGILSVTQNNHCNGKNGCGGEKDACKGKGGCGGDRSECKGKNGCGGERASCKGSQGCDGQVADNSSPEKKSLYADPSKVTSSESSKKDPNDGNMNYKLMTEEELLLELNDEGLRMYKSLNAEGKALALKVASGMCGGTNQCQGFNACKSEHNACAGKGDCAGKGICAFSDKNLAVKVVYDKMAQKRQNLTK